jgi:hypothetical protein
MRGELWGDDSPPAFTDSGRFKMSDLIDTTNDSLVGILGDGIVIAKMRPRLTKAEALRLAAWIVAIADDDDEFPKLLQAVQNT